MSTLTHPQLLNTLGSFFPDNCTIQQETILGRDEFGQPSKSWANVTDHVNIPCLVAEPRLRAQEIREPQMRLTTTRRDILLRGYFSSITVEMRALVRSMTYDIISVLYDSQRITTRLECELVET